MINTLMEFTKPLFIKIRNLTDESIEIIISAMWPETPTIEDEKDISEARTKARRFFQSYRCYLNSDLADHADDIIDQYSKMK